MVDLDKIKCTRECHPGHDYCIFHIPLHKKREDPELAQQFASQFKELYDSGERNYTGFEFPDETDLSKETGFSFTNHEGLERENETACADFKLGIFGNQVSFAFITFGDRAIFWSSSFGDRAKFGATIFGDDAYFGDSTFGDNANFRNSIFRHRAIFGGSTFGQKVFFGGSTFGDNANFRDITFGHFSNFGGSCFGDSVNFWSSTFGDGADFGASTFGDDAYFGESSFGSGAYFGASTFGGFTRFDGAIFTNSVYFSEASGTEKFYQITGDAGEDNEKWQGHIYRTGPLYVRFRQTKFDGPAFFHRTNLAKTRFEMVTLDKVSFWQSQIDQTKFISCSWGSGPENNRFTTRKPVPLFRFRRQGLLFDELELRKNRLDESLTESEKLVDATPADIQVEALQLKKSLEDNKDPIAAGHFHFTAMEMKRLIAQDEGRRFRSWGLWIYKMLNGYGERPGRTAMWLGWLIAIFTVLFFWLNGLAPATMVEPDGTLKAGKETIPLAKQWGYAFSYTFQNVLPFKLGSSYLKTFGPRADWIYWLTGLETFIGSTLFTFFVLALRRRFKR